MNALCAAILLLFAGATAAPLGAAPEERTISVNLKNADVRQVVAYILRGTDVNYAFADDVGGRVTCGLNNVPVERALQAILSASGCEAAEDEGALLIRKRVPPPEAVPAKPPVPAAGIAPADGAPPEGVKVTRTEEAEAREAVARRAESSPAVYYVIVPAVQPQQVEMAPAAPAGYVSPNPGLTAAYEWLRNYGARPFGMNAHPLGNSPGAGRPNMAWFQQMAGASMGGFTPFGVQGFGF